MPGSIHIRFPVGRAHLHPWHAAPNEGRVEWPPSPWRLLRALVAVAGRGLTTLPEPGGGVFSNVWLKTPRDKEKKSQAVCDPSWGEHEDKLRLTALAALLHGLADPPIVWLVRTAVGHTRHFFRVASGRPGKKDPEKWTWVKTAGSAVFDTFAAVDPDQPLVFEWPTLSLQEPEASSARETLHALLRRLMYFGRSESWCEASFRAEAFDPGRTHFPCVAIEDACAFEAHFANPGKVEFRDYSIERRLGWDARPGSLQFLREKFSAPEAEEPELLLRSLLQLSGDSMKHGDRPCGARWFHYAVPKEIFRLPIRRAADVLPHGLRDLQPHSDFQVVRYAINTPTVHRAVLPPMTATLAIAQSCRAATMGIFGRQNDACCSPQLSGKRLGDDKGRYALFNESNEEAVKFGDKNGGHAGHAYWWPVDEDGDGFLDHLVVLCHDGFSLKDMRALRALNRVEQRGNRHDLLLTPVFEGKWKDCPGSYSRRGETVRRFISATPYFSPLHLSAGKSGGRNRPRLSNIIRQAVGRIPHGQDAHLLGVEEIVFDYDVTSLGRRNSDDPRRCAIVHLHADLTDTTGGVLAERGDIVSATLCVPLPVQAADLDSISYRGASLRDPDDPRPLGFSRGLLVSSGQRFVPALEFQRIRSPEDRAKGPGLMLRLTFESVQPARPFAIGQFCHFGLGLFVPGAPTANNQ